MWCSKDFSDTRAFFGTAVGHSCSVQLGSEPNEGIDLTDVYNSFY